MIATVLAIIAYIVYSAVYSANKKYVQKNSMAIKQISYLSKKYTFHTIPPHYTHTKIQKSLAAYRRMDYQQALIDYVKFHQAFFEEEIRQANENNENFKKYCYEFDYILRTKKTNWNSKLKKHIEDKIIAKSKLSPVCSVRIKIENVYTSPQGRNSYHEHNIFNQLDIIWAFSTIKDQESFKSQKQEERAKMSDSLRYDILKRDGFRCVICGASAQDGAKLHVDHIVPVSKGGKTIKSNLRTLCSTCNLGKRDKYDPYGMN